MAFLGKEYTLDRSEGFDDVMNALGIPQAMQDAANKVKSTVKLSESGGMYTLTLKSVNPQVTTFKLGEECDVTTVDGRQVKAVFTLNGNVLTQTEKGDKAMTLVREFGPTETKQTITMGNVKSTRWFKA